MSQGGPRVGGSELGLGLAQRRFVGFGVRRSEVGGVCRCFVFVVRELRDIVFMRKVLLG